MSRSSLRLFHHAFRTVLQHRTLRGVPFNLVAAKTAVHVYYQFLLLAVREQVLVLLLTLEPVDHKVCSRDSGVCVAPSVNVSLSLGRLRSSGIH